MDTNALVQQAKAEVAAGRLSAATRLWAEAVAADPANAEAHRQLGLVFQQRRQFRAAEECFKAAVQAAPHSAAAYNSLGILQAWTHRSEQAMETFRQAIAEEPDSYDAYNNLGLLLKDCCCHVEAERCFLQAIRLNPASAEFYNNFGTLLALQGREAEARACFAKALLLKPDFPGAYRNMGLLQLRTNNLDEAENCFKQAIALKPDFWQVQSVLGRVYLMKGEYMRGWQQYEWRLESPLFDKLPYPQWRGESLVDKSIILYYEQGFGDIMQFVRYAPLVAARAARTVLWVLPELRRLMEDSADGFEVLRPDELAGASFDYACPLMSLPLAFAAEIPQNVPYLMAGAATAEAWREILTDIDAGQKLRVGIVWAGNPRHHNDHNRSIPFASFARLLAVRQAVHWISLQVGRRERELQATAVPVTVFRGCLTDFAETAGLIANLDLVVTVDSAVAHLAGGMGKRVWMLVPYAADWRWQMQRPDSPWYPTMRIFRQPAKGNWEAVLDEVASCLQELLIIEGRR